MLLAVEVEREEWRGRMEHKHSFQDIPAWANYAKPFYHQIRIYLSGQQSFNQT